MAGNRLEISPDDGSCRVPGVIMTLMETTNPALKWAAILVDEIARAGVANVVIAPGSRSTPLTLAFAAQPSVRIYSLLDERGAAFFALGLALESGRPAAVLCTSGTAAANFFPAVIEASQSHVPLIVLTADRPAELRGTGANQTIDQVGIYGKYTRLAADLLPPVDSASAQLLRSLRTTVDRAITAALLPVPGPVHLNVPFRKPLEPRPGETLPDGTAFARPDRRPFTEIRSHSPVPIVPEVDWPARGLILAGPRCPGNDFPDALAALHMKTGYPVIADALSGLRYGRFANEAAPLNPQVCKAMADGAVELPDLILQFGTVPVSNPAISLLGSLPESTTRISVQAHGTWHDDAHTLSHLVHTDPAEFCRMLADQIPYPIADRAWSRHLEQAEKAYWAAVDEAKSEHYFEGLVLQDVLDAVPDGARLFVANSLAVRHLDEWTRPIAKNLRVFCNRGASGIDGTISTALGIAAASDQPIVLVLGDLAFYHDLNGLLALKRGGVRATIVLLNNDGGGIFRRLPVAEIEPPFTGLFLTPHGLDFAPAAEMFGTGYSLAKGQSELKAALRAAVNSTASQVIEIRTDSALHESTRRRIAAAWMENHRL